MAWDDFVLSFTVPDLNTIENLCEDLDKKGGKKRP